MDILKQYDVRLANGVVRQIVAIRSGYSKTHLLWL